MSEYVEWQPHPALAPWVRSMHGYRLQVDGPGVHIGLPSGLMTLVVALDEPLLLSHGGGPAPTPYESIVAGLHTAPAHIHHDGRQAGIEVDLEPGAARAMFGIPAAALTGSGLELHSLTGLTAGEVDRVREAGAWQDRFAALEAILMRRLDPGRDNGPASLAWRHIQRAQRPVRIADVAADLGYSTRRLQQLFRAEYGIGAKDAASVRRFERAHRMVGSGVPLADVAARCGFADQAHLTRDWRRFAGVPPTTWLREDALRYGTESAPGRKPSTP